MFYLQTKIHIHRLALSTRPKDTLTSRISAASTGSLRAARIESLNNKKPSALPNWNDVSFSEPLAASRRYSGISGVSLSSSKGSSEHFPSETSMISDDVEVVQREAASLEHFVSTLEQAEKTLVILRDQIPPVMFAGAVGIVIGKISSAGCIVEGGRGHGVLLARQATKAGCQWGLPAAVTFSGCGVGLTAGTSTKHLVMLIMSERGLRRFVSAGFRAREKANLIHPGNEIESRQKNWGGDVVLYSVTKSRELGVRIGRIQALCDKKNHALYGTGVRSRDVLWGARNGRYWERRRLGVLYPLLKEIEAEGRDRQWH
eukprot:comp22142_c0_seq2/m.32422 comp22142_c0_seq2/g.32422  ORF comp22142_c0_seq2/g.32422 comp22142_c0_seq2/m.32422 type:complete len:316 (-) comp22142_c0_seq2:423-1370(-)